MRLFFVFTVQTITTKNLEATQRATLHVATDMVNAASCYVTIMAARTSVLVSVRHLRKDLAIGKFYRFNRARNRCRIIHFAFAMTANGQMLS